MKYIKTIVSSLFAVVLMATTAFSAEPGQWNVTLGGSGASTVKSTSTTFGTELGVGHTGNFLLPFEAGVRQSFSYASGRTEAVGSTRSSEEGPSTTVYSRIGNSLVGSTRLYSDFTVLPLGNLQVAAGLSGGANYGNSALVWTAGPEVVARLFLKSDVYLFGRVEYDAVLNGRTSVRQTENDSFRFAVGVGCRF